MLVVKYQIWDRKTDYATLPEDDLSVRFVEKMRDVGRLGPFRQIEGTGKFLKDRVMLSFHDARRGDGGRVSSSFSRVHLRLLDHRNVVRVLSDADRDELDHFDEQIADQVEQLETMRKKRADWLRAAWRRAQPFGLQEIEDRAKEGA